MGRRMFLLLVSVAVVSGFAGGLVSRLPSRRIITARELRVVDRNGNLRARLGTSPELLDWVFLELCDPDATRRVGLMACPQGTAQLKLYEKNGTCRAEFTVAGASRVNEPEEVVDYTPRLELHGRDGKSRADLALDSSGDVALRLWGGIPMKPPGATLIVSEDDSPEIRLQGSDLGILFSAP